VAGITLGVAVAQYLRVIHGRLIWVLVVAALVIAQGVRLLGLDAVLIALAGGCALRYVAPGESERVRDELSDARYRSMAYFLPSLGAASSSGCLDELVAMGAASRGPAAVGLWGGLRWAGRHGAVGPDWVRYGWLGFISQSGLALTFAALLRRAFPEWNVSLEALVVAMIGVHELAGPICFHWVLRRTAQVTVEQGRGDRTLGIRLVRLRRLVGTDTVGGGGGPLCLLVVAACSSGTAPTLRACTAADSAVSLTVNQYVSIDPATVAGCFGLSCDRCLQRPVPPRSPAHVRRSWADGCVRLGGDTILPAPSAPVQPASAVNPPSSFTRFCAWAMNGARGDWFPKLSGGAKPQVSAAASPPGMGTLRTFQVCAKTDCTRFDRVGARVRALKTKVAIYVDTLAPSGASIP